MVNLTENNVTNEEESQEIINVFNYLMYSLVVLLGVPGNILLVWSLMSIRKEKVNKCYKILVINLAVNDILMALITVPFTIAELAVGTFPFGHAMCVLLWPLQTACFGAGVFNMVALNVHRYYVISYPTSGWSIEKLTVIAVVLCWLIPTMITALPYAIHLEFQVDETGVGSCSETWLESSANAYTIYLFVVQYVLPLVIIATLNTLTIRNLKRGRLFQMSSANIAEESLHAHRRIVKMLVVIVLIFALFGLPGQIMWLLPVFTNVDSDPNYFAILSLVDIFPFMYCVLNPVVFFTYNADCHKKLKKLLSRTLFCCRYHWKGGSRGLASSMGSMRNDAGITLLSPTTRISESQDTSQSDGTPKSNLFATAIPQYLLDEYKKVKSVKETDSSNAKQRNGLVPLALFSTLNGICGSDMHQAKTPEAAPARSRVSRLLGTAGDQEIFRESFVELLRTTNLNNELMMHLDASPETAITENSYLELLSPI